jgi:hypothetical protein
VHAVGGQQGAQAGAVQEADLASADGKQAQSLQAVQGTHHGFQGQRQEAADVGAGHAQAQVERAVAQPLQAGAQVQQERDHALLGVEGGEPQHPLPIAAELPRGHRGQPRLRPRRGRQQVLRQLPGLPGIQRDGIAGVLGQVQRLQAQQRAAQVEAGDALASLGVHQPGLEDPGMDQEQRIARLPGTVEELARAQRPGAVGQARRRLRLRHAWSDGVSGRARRAVLARPDRDHHHHRGSGTGGGMRPVCGPPRGTR